MKLSHQLAGFFIAVATILILPTQVDAAWWNPLDWFKSDKSLPLESQNATTSSTSSSDAAVTALVSENALLRKQISQLLQATSQCKLSAAQAAVTRSAAAIVSTPPAVVVNATPSASTQTKTDAENAKKIRVELARTDKLDLDIDTLYATYLKTYSEKDKDAFLDFLRFTKKNTGELYFPKSAFNLTSSLPPPYDGDWVKSDINSALPAYLHKQVAAYRADLKINLSQYPASESAAQ